MDSFHRFVLALCFTPPLIAQTSTGTIVGAVTDPSGTAVANCRITIRHLPTSEFREIMGNERGEFSVPFLRIGDYSVAAVAQGFKTKHSISEIRQRI